jgi:large subunit ribosomal protein L18
LAIKRLIARKRRQARVRKRVSGTTEKPRLSVFKSARHIYAQVIDDEKRVTIVGASSTGKDFKGHSGHRGNVEAAKKLGEIIGKKAVEKGVKQVVFDRGGNLYHGRIRAVAEAAREAGLEF